MPELPDLIVFAETLNKKVTNKKITAISSYDRGRLKVSVEDLSRALTGNTIEHVERSGKEICFRISNGNLMFIHLMLMGGFTLTTHLNVVEFPIISFVFEENLVLTLHDPKGWATVYLGSEDGNTAVDAVDINVDTLKRLIAQKPKTSLKAFLGDQKIMRGIGNAYSDEILWEARISPKSVAGKLPQEAIEALAAAIPSVLNAATAQLRKSHPEILSGRFREFLGVHNPSRSVSPTGHPIKNEIIASKKTYFTEEQLLYK